ncbi:MAG: hypothetical protein IBX56_07700 [Methylomicrobium sp.]|nr:hypothetical protein [Methylomicrobium sp.]
MSQFNFYEDSALTSPAAIRLVQTANVLPPPVDVLVYLGATSAGWVLENAAEGDPILVFVDDSDIGSGLSGDAVKLALSSAGLDGASGGVALALPTSIASGAANAIPVYIRFEPQNVPVGRYVDLSLRVNDVIEYQP